ISVRNIYLSRHKNRLLKKTRPTRRRLALEYLEDRTLLSSGQWVAYFNGYAAAASLNNQTQIGINLLQSHGISDQTAQVIKAFDYSGAFFVQTATSVTQQDLTTRLTSIPGFVFVQEYETDKGQPAEEPGEDLIDRDALEETFGEFDYDNF